MPDGTNNGITFLLGRKTKERHEVPSDPNQWASEDGTRLPDRFFILYQPALVFGM